MKLPYIVTDVIPDYDCTITEGERRSAIRDMLEEQDRLGKLHNDLVNPKWWKRPILWWLRQWIAKAFQTFCRHSRRSG